jgi:hypothetical protein
MEENCEILFKKLTEQCKKGNYESIIIISEQLSNKFKIPIQDIINPIFVNCPFKTMEQIIYITKELNKIDQDDFTVKLIYGIIKELRNYPSFTTKPDISIILNDYEFKKFTDAFSKYLY